MALPGVCAQAQPVLAFPRAGRSAAVFVGAAALPGTALSAHVPGTFPRAPAGVGPSTLLPPPARCGTAALASARAQCWPAWPRAVARPGSCAWCGAAAQCRSHFCGAPSAALLLAARLALHPFLSFASRLCACLAFAAHHPLTPTNTHSVKGKEKATRGTVAIEKWARHAARAFAWWRKKALTSPPCCCLLALWRRWLSWLCAASGSHRRHRRGLLHKHNKHDTKQAWSCLGLSERTAKIKKVWCVWCGAGCLFS